jgi:hypothetical protein
MIRRFSKKDASAYYNVIEMVVIWLISQYYDFLTLIGLFDVETQKYNTGRLFWYVCMLIGVLVLFMPFYLAAIIYIVNTIRKGLI